MAETPKPGALKPMRLTVVDKGETLQISDVQRWVDERKILLRDARQRMQDWNGKPSSLYKQHGNLVRIAQRLAEIKAIFDQFKAERDRRANDNIIALVAYFSDPETMAGIDD